jgi:hypothetical protein
MWRRVRAGGARPLCAHDRHESYAIGQRIRERIEEASGWIKTVAGQANTRFRGGADRTGLRVCGRRLQSAAPAQVAGEPAMSEPGECQIVGQ